MIRSLTKQHNDAQAKTNLAWRGTDILVLILLFYVKRQRTYKRRFQQLMQDKERGPKGRIVDLHTKEETQDISGDIVEELLEKLDRFERNKKHLNSNLSLNKLAKELHTNQNYLSRVINLKMEKNFPQYLNDLRIRYAVNELKTNKIFRKHSIKAIAEECGYSPGSSFSRVFYITTGIQPSYYI